MSSRHQEGSDSAGYSAGDCGVRRSQLIAGEAESGGDYAARPGPLGGVWLQQTPQQFSEWPGELHCVDIGHEVVDRATMSHHLGQQSITNPIKGIWQICRH